MSTSSVKYPFGPADVLALTAAASQPLTITNQLTIVDGVTTIALTNNRTLTLTIDASVTAGAKIFLKTKSTATETTIFSTGITAPTITGVAGKTFTQEFTYDGTTFKPSGLSVQID